MAGNQKSKVFLMPYGIEVLINIEKDKTLLYSLLVFSPPVKLKKILKVLGKLYKSFI